MKLVSSVMLILLVVFLLCQASLAQSREVALPRSMKGYELYSWQIRGEWYFSLLVGTNRLKTRNEVTSTKVRVKGIKALKKKLNRLPKDEDISWSASLISRMTLLPDEVIEEIKAYCDQRGIILRLS